MDSRGRPGKFGEYAWLLGAQAFELLSQLNGAEITEQQYYEHATTAERVFDEMFEDLAPLINAGHVSIATGQNKRRSVEEIQWTEQDWVWKMEFFHQLFQAVDKSENSAISADIFSSEEYRQSCLWAIFSSLEQAIMAAFFDDPYRSGQFLMEAATYLQKAEAQDALDIATEQRLKVLESQRASERAKVKHAKSPVRLAKDLAREMFDAWRAEPQQYASASAFARAMLDKFPDELRSEVVVTRWVREWKRATK